MKDLFGNVLISKCIFVHVYNCCYARWHKTFFPLIFSLVNFYYEGMLYSQEIKYCTENNVKYFFLWRHLYRTLFYLMPTLWHEYDPTYDDDDDPSHLIIFRLKHFRIKPSVFNFMMIEVHNDLFWNTIWKLIICFLRKFILEKKLQ